MTDPTPLELAEGNLAALQRRIRRGEGSPLDLGAAQARVAHARLRDKGTRARQRDDLARTRARVTGDAKLAASGLPSRKPDLPGKHDYAAEAIEDLARAVEKHNVWILDVAKALQARGVPALEWDRVRPERFDPDNHAVLEQGGGVSSVTVGGRTYRPANAGPLALHAFRVAATRRKLEDDHGRRLDLDLGKDTPDALRDQ
ncbi:hypothetical protein EDF54_1586 [Rathayibacter sp. PhB93]|uniref:hypothetical protein n=1 Tax=unclassified Rathayibacter TaxID=2609250 RepID=UPI000FC2B691|nr:MULTISPECIES: hypothetical protein [unclassified Rathayibacter]ROQ06623.1 hypothetical protein EDF54_1586 [Rathayibacter sp. PhB93]TDQ14380.1 hypothetical protein EDF17_1405 [Rathayibacter sp. PhB1]